MVHLDEKRVGGPPINHRPSSTFSAPGTRHSQRVILLVILVDGLHAGATRGAAVLGILGHGHHMLHPILVDLLQGSLSEWPERKLPLSCSGHF